MRPPTERQAVLAARQLHYHRARLGWLKNRMRENEATLSLYLAGLETRAAILPGGYQISGEHASPDHGVAIEKLAPSASYEQLSFHVGDGETAHEAPSGVLPDGGERQRAAEGEGRLTYAERGCVRCFDGVVHVGGPAEVRTAPCPDCCGTGKVLSYLYPRPKGRRGPWPPEEPAQRRRPGDTR
ncbi:hypothetical protein GBA65_07270 [Rubrobacter marinus]|uniref:Uncharacterized protein n=1 Tax=Rubrobacter marinus TaxID=2653852 RepID=A0A6G8PVZ0_9ACTN|nr:hypothetical protein [Rubrobacter marinus]QIN78353.1 hypothetical protein GBA65_07270 [Rubrobacter marinus]